MKPFERIFLLGVGFTNATEQEVLEFIITGLKKSQVKYYIVTPNPELLVIANKNLEYKQALNNAKLALADGIGVLLGGQFMAKPLKQRITGVDLTESLCKAVAKQPITVSFLGGGPNIAELTAECLREKYSGLRVSWVAEEPKNSLIRRPTDILFVAFGSPKQEIWISQNLNKINAKVIIGVGGTFDFISGKVSRAPRIIRDLGFEWLYRLIRQPWRIKRQLSLITFIWLVLKERFLSKNNIS